MGFHVTSSEIGAVGAVATIAGAFFAAVAAKAALNAVQVARETLRETEVARKAAEADRLAADADRKAGERDRRAAEADRQAAENDRRAAARDRRRQRLEKIGELIEELALEAKRDRGRLVPGAFLAPIVAQRLGRAIVGLEAALPHCANLVGVENGMYDSAADLAWEDVLEALRQIDHDEAEAAVKRSTGEGERRAP